ncbi:MAG: hypothetical protein JXX28_19245 [Deltaproteobacteria bacterium]|nr:hypothetical protein [Deltaproteobacteria bacterium]
MGHTLYATADQLRFYYLPDDAELTEGTLLLRSLTGRKRRVLEEEVSQHQVSEERAKELVRETVTQVSRGMGRFLNSTMDTLRQARVATPDAERRDPKEVLRGLREVGEGLRETLRQGLSEAPADAAAARERLEAIAGSARENVSEALGDAMASLPEGLRDFLDNPRLEREVRAATEAMERLGEHLRAGPVGEE